MSNIDIEYTKAISFCIMYLLLTVLVLMSTVNNLSAKKPGLCDRREGSRCYWWHKNDRKNWADARATCKSEGGDLATIDTAVEHNFLVSLLLVSIICLYVNLFRMLSLSLLQFGLGGLPRRYPSTAQNFLNSMRFLELFLKIFRLAPTPGGLAPTPTVNPGTAPVLVTFVSSFCQRYL